MMDKTRRQKTICLIFSSLILVLVFLNQLPGQTTDSREQQLKAELKTHPESLSAHFELGKFYFESEKNNAARQHFLAVIGIDSQNAPAYAYLGHLYLREKKHQQAITFFQQAVKWQPDNALALDGLKQIQTYEKLQSQLQEIRTRVLQEKWNDAHRQLINLPEPAKKLSDYRQLRQTVAQHLYEKGSFQFRAQSWVTALDYFTRLQELLPDYLDVPEKIRQIEQQLNSQNELENEYAAGNRAFQLQQWAGALRHFERVLKIDKNYKDTRQKWQAAFAARDAALIATENALAESSRNKAPVIDTAKVEITSAVDSAKNVVRPPDSLQAAESDSISFYQNIPRHYFYWFGVSLLILLAFWGILSRKSRRKQRRNQRQAGTRRVKLEVKIKRENQQVPEIDSNEISTVRLRPEKLPTSPYKRFELKQQVAQFDQVQVFLAQDKRLNRKVLIDRISLNGNGKLSAKEIISGVQTAANLNHPNIIRVEDVFFQEDVVFIVMEHTPGIALTEMLTGRKPGELLQSIRIVRDCCLALNHAHRNEIFHANLHPFYVKIADDETIKLAGFELASLHTVFPKNQTGELSDLVAYQAPEQLRDGTTDGRTDIFSLGIIFYELLTLNNPFQGESNAAVVFNILEGNPIPPREINPDIPQKLDSLVMKMLAKNRGDRYFNIFDIALDLNKFI